MKEWIWDGEMDCGWEDLSQLLKNVCSHFTRTMLKTTSFSSAESKELITLECMERFESITGVLADIIQEGGYYQYEDLTNDYQNAKKLNSWILLGSLTETLLQIFLAFYINDYKNTKWQQWQDFKLEQVQQPIISFIQKLVDEGSLIPEQARSLKRAIKDTIKEHTKEHCVERIMFDELIQLFTSLELFDEDEIDYLKMIQSNRNGVHAFQSRKIGTWADLQHGVRFFCYLMDWVLEHIPDISDAAYNH